MTKLINIPAEIRKYWWEKSENLINVPGTTISDSRVFRSPIKFSLSIYFVMFEEEGVLIHRPTFVSKPT